MLAHFNLTHPLNRNFTFALIASVLFHAALLSLHFHLPNSALKRHTASKLDIILVNSRHPQQPIKAQAIAQANLEGGGDIEENRIAKTPLPAMPQTQTGTNFAESKRLIRALEMQQRQLLAQTQSSAHVPKQTQQALSPNTPNTPTPSPLGTDLTEQTIAIEKLEAQIARNIEAYNRRPRKHTLSPSTTEAVEALYIEAWRQKVERIGNLNYPTDAKGKLYGSLILYLEINASGELEKVDIARSSGYPILDNAAVRVVKQASPYGKFPEDMKKTYDILMFSRTWTYTHDDQLQAE